MRLQRLQAFDAEWAPLYEDPYTQRKVPYWFTFRHSNRQRNRRGPRLCVNKTYSVRHLLYYGNWTFDHASITSYWGWSTLSETHNIGIRWPIETYHAL